MCIRDRIRGGVSLDAANEEGVTALIIAVREGNEPMTKLLIEKRASINAVDMDFNTALMWAAQTSQVEIAALLLERDASVNEANESGSTALIWAGWFRAAFETIWDVDMD